MTTVKTQGVRRIATDIPELDAMLSGGVPAFSLVVIGGRPGTGKSILSQQMLFRAAARGRKGLYLGTLSESPLKSARYQSAFSFFDPDAFGESVVYMDLAETIRNQDPEEAIKVITAVLTEHQPELVVIDSFRAIHDLTESLRGVRTFAYDLAVELSAINATTFLVGEYEEADIGRLPEFAVADGIIWLSLEKVGVGVERFLRILKMRGVDHPTLPFGFDIDRNGFNLFYVPAVAERVPKPDGPPVSTGVPGLDLLLRGGIPRGTTQLISGEAGTGKTTLGLQFLHEGASRGEKGVFFSYEQDPEDLAGLGRSFGWDFGPLVRDGRVRFHYTPLPMLNAAKEIVRVRRILAETGATRAVIDSLTMMMHGVEQVDVVRRQFFDLTSIFSNAACTALILIDPPAGTGLISRFGVEESIADGVIVLKNGREGQDRKRFLEIAKLRGVSHAGGDSVMRIDSQGIRVFPRAEEALR